MANPSVPEEPAAQSTPCELTSDSETLAGWLVAPPVARKRLGIVLAHGFAHATGASLTTPMRSLGERIAGAMGVTALAFGSRGVDRSTGSFSLRGWLTDLGAAAEFLGEQPGIDTVGVIGFGTGGALGICAAHLSSRIDLAASLGSPADFDDWANYPRDLLLWGRELGVVAPDAFEDDFDDWSAELSRYKAVTSAEHLGDMPLLVMHGSEDDVVPPLDARMIADSHGSADLRIISGSGHHLRHDPRAMAVLLGWLDRQLHQLGAEDVAS